MTTAAPNTTPVSSVLGHEERITALEKDNHELRQALQSAIEAHNGLTLRVQGILRTHALISLAQNDRLRHLETVDRNDRRLTELMDTFERRVSAIEVATRVLAMPSLRERIGRAPMGGEVLS